MSFWQRAAQRWVGGLVLAAMLGSAFVPLFGNLHAELDAECADDAWGSHHQTSQIESVRPAVADDHCALCHLQRAMRGAADDAKRFIDTTDLVARHVVVVGHQARAHERRTVASRAPPASF